MPTIMTHGVVGLALAAKAGWVRVSNRKSLLITSVICAMLLRTSISSASNSASSTTACLDIADLLTPFFFAAFVAVGAGWFLNRRNQEGRLANFCKLSLSLSFSITASYPLLDAMTNGGGGCRLALTLLQSSLFFHVSSHHGISPMGIDGFFGGLAEA